MIFEASKEEPLVFSKVEEAENNYHQIFMFSWNTNSPHNIVQYIQKIIWESSPPKLSNSLEF